LRTPLENPATSFKEPFTHPPLKNPFNFEPVFKMVAQPQLHNDIYPAIDPSKFVGSQKGVVCVVIGSSQ
jgi:hypothetical protein